MNVRLFAFASTLALMGAAAAPARPTADVSAVLESRPPGPAAEAQFHSVPTARRSGRLDGVWHEAVHTGRSGASVVFDSRRGRVLQFGGTERNGLTCAALWVFDPRGARRWEPLIVRGESPRGRALAAAIYDSERDRVVMFGGMERTSEANLATLDDLWELDFRGEPRWRRIEIAGSTPSPRENCGVALDEARGRLLLIGGRRFTPNVFGASYTYTNEVWALDLRGPARWEELHPLGGPLPTAGGFGCAYDGDLDAVIVLGGFGTIAPQTFSGFNTVWKLSLDGTPEWTSLGPDQLGPAGVPVGGSSLAVVFDRAQHRVIVFSGRDSVTKAFVPGSGAPWETLGAGSGAPGRGRDQSLVQDPKRGTLFLTGLVLDEPLWRLEPDPGAQWEVVSPVVETPPVGAGFTLTADPARGRVLLAGGTIREFVSGMPRDRPVDEAWTFSLRDARWERLDAGPMPVPGITGHRAVLDRERDRLLLFGGSVPGPTPNSLVPHRGLLALSLDRRSEWISIPVFDWPESLGTSPAVVLDTRRDRLLFAGRESNDFGPAPLWKLPLEGAARVTALDVGYGPTGASGFAMVLDPRGDRLIVERDPSSSMSPDDVPLWQVGLSRGDGWTRLHPSGTGPDDTQRQALFEGAGGHHALRIGGRSTTDGRRYQNDSRVWSLEYEDPFRDLAWNEVFCGGPDPLDILFPQVAFDDLRSVVIATRAPRVPGQFPDTYWLELPSREPAGSPGTRWERTAGPGLPSGPQREPRLSVVPVSPPATQASSVRVRLSLPGTSDASVELVDLAGRRIDRRSMIAGPGTVELDFAGTSRLAPGLYWVVLRQGGETASARIAVLH